MEEEIDGGGGGGGAIGVGVAEYWWWATASAVQLAWGISAYRRGGSAVECRLMPVKAFAVASLFVGASASAAVAGLRYSGIHSVEDMKGVGANIRTGLGIRPR